LASKGFDAFQKSYDKFEKNFDKTRKGINQLQLPKVQAINRMLELHVDLAKFSKVTDYQKMADDIITFDFLSSLYS